MKSVGVAFSEIINSASNLKFCTGTKSIRSKEKSALRRTKFKADTGRLGTQWKIFNNLSKTIFKHGFKVKIRYFIYVYILSLFKKYYVSVINN